MPIQPPQMKTRWAARASSYSRGNRAPHSTSAPKDPQGFSESEQLGLPSRLNKPGMALLAMLSQPINMVGIQGLVPILAS
ncbi:hypothetical protein Nepgr_032237 [Nepenthes gracilis]|uniref:Uncharacterized protein n=1 Tax=Nepenthes gracilis TaxID=150966 RepID=A0AAD3TJQ7_NEPGR|nr:hypothetical protein Nepgr_032237 [Nepenthes gracilis]